MQKTDIIIIGGGIVGLATAYQILEKNPKLNLTLLEKENQVAKHQTGNNSGVIHSGIYYKPNSLKAKNCIQGYHLLLDFCNKEEISYELCGKIIVAANKGEIPALNNIFERGKINGLEGIKKITAEEIKEHEPYCVGVDGIYVPQAGIIDYKVVANKMAEKIQEQGTKIEFGQKVINIKNEKGITTVTTEKRTFEARLVINCAGLYSDKLAKFSNSKLDIQIIPFRGEYYKLKEEKEYLLKGLIYPVPNPDFPFLDVHLTKQVGGGVEAGPNAVLAYRREGYKKTDFDLSEFWETLAWSGFRKVASKYWRTGLGELYRSYSKKAFTQTLQKLVPDVKQEDLIPGGAGVRAQACDRQGNLLDDFKILQNQGIIDVCNAPSPAATSSLAIGKSISEKALAVID
jgi:L-2-hydroxyglutarate oxidase